MTLKEAKIRFLDVLYQANQKSRGGSFSSYKVGKYGDIDDTTLIDDAVTALQQDGLLRINGSASVFGGGREVSITTQGIEQMEEWLESSSAAQRGAMAFNPSGGTVSGKKVFIVHGWNHGVRDKIERYLNKELNLETVIMMDGPHGGRTLPEKFEQEAAGAGYAVFLATGDEYLVEVDPATGAAKAGAQPFKRARPNVFIEIGYFWHALGRGRVALLVEEDVERPTDLQGVAYIPITPDLGETKRLLRKELAAAGLCAA